MSTETVSVSSSPLESVIFGLADMIVLFNEKTSKTLSVKTKGFELARLKLEGWVGQNLADFIEIDSISKFAVALKARIDLDNLDPKELDADWRHINFFTPAKLPAPLLIKVFQFPGQEELVIAARDLGYLAKMQQKLIEAHLSMEREYLRLRHLEARYNTLFENSTDPILLVDLATKKIVQANSAASAALMQEDTRTMVGTEFSQYFGLEHTESVEKLLSSAQNTGKTKVLRARSNSSAQDFTITPSLIVQEGGPQLMVRLSGNSSAQGLDAGKLKQELFTEALQSAPYGFLVTDVAGIVLHANEEFVTLTGSFSLPQVLGKPLESWLARGGVDWSVLSNNLKQLTTLRNFATELLNQSGSTVEVEISATTLSTNERRFAFFIRDVHRLSQTRPVASSNMADSVSQLSQLVGRMPMRDIVGETTDMIEKMCIQSALELTQNNRASAAEMLGLSRQSLYVKLNRYGMAD